MGHYYIFLPSFHTELIVYVLCNIYCIYKPEYLSRLACFSLFAAWQETSLSCIQGPLIEISLAPPTVWYPSSGALSPLLIGPFPRVRHIQTSAVVCVLLSSILSFSLYTSGRFSYVWTSSFMR